MTEQQANTEPATFRQYAFWWATLLLVLGAVIGAGVLRLIQMRTGGSSRAVSSSRRVLEDLGGVSDFTLTERSGRTITRVDLAGRVWVADFIFTSCAGVCPMMSSMMARLQDELFDVSDAMLVSISVDPARDTPERLSRYARRYSADSDRWWFLTGDKNVIYRLCRESFRLSVEEVPEEEREADAEEVLHSSKFVLLDKKGRIRGYYDGMDASAIEILAADVRSLLVE